MANDEAVEPGNRDPESPLAVPPRTLVGAFLTLLLLTLVTVSASEFGRPPISSLAVAMVAATIQAALMLAVFMRLWFDRGILLLLLVVAVVFSGLLVQILEIDRTEYQPAIDQWEGRRAAPQ